MLGRTPPPPPSSMAPFRIALPPAPSSIPPTRLTLFSPSSRRSGCHTSSISPAVRGDSCSALAAPRWERTVRWGLAHGRAGQEDQKRNSLGFRPPTREAVEGMGAAGDEKADAAVDSKDLRQQSKGAGQAHRLHQGPAARLPQVQSAMAAKSDVFHFHLITGVWVSPAERCFLWMGGFRPSDLLKTLVPQLDPLTEQQVVGICNLQQSSQQAEEALSQGLDQLHQSLPTTMAGGSLSEETDMSFMGQMALALSNLSNLEGFVIQADNLRQ